MGGLAFEEERRLLVHSLAWLVGEVANLANRVGEVV